MPAVILCCARQKQRSVTHVVSIDLVCTPVCSASTSAATVPVTFRTMHTIKSTTLVSRSAQLASKT